jgi:hypothetical protein
MDYRAARRRALVMLLLASPLTRAADKRGRAMLRLTLAPVALPEDVRPHRVVFAAPAARMVLGAMAQDRPGVLLYELQGGVTRSLGRIDLLLPARTDFDVVTTADGKLLVAYEEHGGAVAMLRFAAPLGGTLPQAPPKARIASESHPRFVRGSNAAVVVSEDTERAVYISTGTAGTQRTLCACLDAIVTVTPNGPALVSKRLRPGPALAGVLPGTLMLEWPAGQNTAPVVLFRDRPVFDYDVTAAGSDLLIAAITREGPIAVIAASDGSMREVVVEGLPPALEAFSPALHVIARTATLALLANDTVAGRQRTVLFTGTVGL